MGHNYQNRLKMERMPNDVIIEVFTFIDLIDLEKIVQDGVYTNLIVSNKNKYIRETNLCQYCQEIYPRYCPVCYIVSRGDLYGDVKNGGNFKLWAKNFIRFCKVYNYTNYDKFPNNLWALSEFCVKLYCGKYNSHRELVINKDESFQRLSPEKQQIVLDDFDTHWDVYFSKRYIQVKRNYFRKQ